MYVCSVSFSLLMFVISFGFIPYVLKSYTGGPEYLRDMRCSSGEDAYSQWRRMRSFWLCPYLISFLHGAVVSLSSCSAPMVHGWLGVHWPCSSEKEENLAEYLKLFLYLCAGWL